MRWLAVGLFTLTQLTTVAAETLWQPAGGGVVPAGTNVVSDIETIPADGGLRVRGWVVDAFSATRADMVEITDLTGRRLAEVSSGGFERRPDVAQHFGSSAYSLSGFQVFITQPPPQLVVRAHLGQLGWWQTTVTSPTPLRASVIRFECSSPDLVEIQVTSSEPFPVRGALAEFHSGSTIVQLSRYPDDGDTHSLIFTLTADQFAALSKTDNAFVTYNPSNGSDIWSIGPIDPARAVGCARPMVTCHDELPQGDIDNLDPGG